MLSGDFIAGPLGGALGTKVADLDQFGDIIGHFKKRLRVKEVLGAETPGILVPMYIYPTPDIWTDPNYNALITAAKENPDIQFHVILNPASGPGTAVDANYERAVRRLQGAGCFVYGYVATGYSARLPADVFADVDTWLSLYGRLDGIFFDEMSNADTQADADLYASYKDYAHSKGFRIAIGNPGTTVPPRYFLQDVMDVIVTHETNAYPDETIYLGDWPDSYMEFDKNQRAALVYAQASLNRVQLELACKYNGMVYVTSGDLPSPWSVFPAYFQELVDVVKGTLRSRMYGDSSLTTDGYQKLPSGLIIQWGYYAGGASGVAVTFPVAFPTAALNVSATIDDGVGTTVQAVSVTGLTTTGFTARQLDSAGGVTSAFYWTALGV